MDSEHHECMIEIKTIDPGTQQLNIILFLTVPVLSPCEQPALPAVIE